jgi:sulfate permease, SulP family
VLDELAERPKALILDFSEVPLLDSTTEATLDVFTRKASRSGARVYVTGLTRQARRALMTQGLRPPRVRFRSNTGAAIAFARRSIGTSAARQ